MKKTLAILLALALVLCMMPSAAFAGTEVYSFKTIDKTVFQYDGKDAGQAPVVTLQKSTDGAAAVEVTDGYTLKYRTKNNDGSYSEAIATKPQNAGEYKICAFVGASEVCSKEFSIKPYNFTGVTIAIENQTVKPIIGQNGAADFPSDGVKFSRGTSAITSADEIALIKSGLQVNMTVTGNRYTVNFSVKDEQTSNFEGSIPPTSFDYVLDIDDSSISIKDGKGTSVITQIVGGDYNNQEKKVQDLFTLYRTDGSTEKKLTYGTDYSFTCADSKNVGSHKVIIKGKGIYGGSREIDLVITGRNADLYVKADAIADQTEYTLHSVKPVLKDSGLGKTLEEGKDYQIVSYNGVAGSKGYVTVAFIGNYSGAAKDIEFNVVSNDKNVETMDVYLGDEKLEGSSKVFTSAYMYRGVALPVNGLIVYTDYTNKKKLSTNYYSVVYEYEENGKTISTTSPVDAKTYNVSIVGKNGYAGKKLLGTYNIPKFDIKNTTISVSGVSTSSTPTVTVKSIYDNITFVKDKDYTVTSSSYVSNGKVLVTVTPTSTGNLGGASRSDYYPVVAKSIASCRTYFTNGRSSTPYTGSSIVVDVKVEDGNYNVLRERTDYTISYKLDGKEVYSIKDAGVYTIEIKGINGYTGTTSLTFTVIGIDISDYVVTLKTSSVVATGKVQTPVISSVKKGVYSTLFSSDYTVSYQDATGKTVTSMSAPGTYKVVVTGKNGYTGSTYATFRIVGTPQEIKVAKTSYKVYKDSDSFKINASATGDGTGFSYVSSNPEVATVSATGVVTIHKIGRAKITVTTTGTKKSEPASEEVYVKVYPDKAKITQKPQTEGNKGSFRVRWEKQDDVTYYEIRYARNSKFTSGTYLTKKVNASTLNYTTQSTKISNLTSGAKYYVKVRAVKVVTNDYGQQLKYYGTWSNWRSVVTK